MRIMKIVYMQEKSELRSQEESASYMGEESWQVGEKFNGEFIKGEVHSIVESPDGYSVWVLLGNTLVREAMFIPLHAVQRIYYGEE